MYGGWDEEGCMEGGMRRDVWRVGWKHGMDSRKHKSYLGQQTPQRTEG